MRAWIKDHGLALAMFGLFAAFLVAQSITGWQAHNADLSDHEEQTLSYGSYMTTGHFVEATFENWESEFLQMAAYVVLTIWLVQKGSSESKPPEGEQEVDADPRKARRDPDAPGPVRRGGWLLRLYENSLGIAFAILFLLSITLHALGGASEYKLGTNGTRRSAGERRPFRDDVHVLVPVVPELAERVPCRRRRRDALRLPPSAGLARVQTGRGSPRPHRKLTDLV